MIWFGLAILLVIVGAVLIAKGPDYYDKFEDVMGFILIGGAVIAIVVGGGGNWLGMAFTDTKWTTSTWKLKSFSNSSAIEGSFFLGSGTVNEEAVYYYYWEDPNGFFSLQSIAARYAYIKESDETPKLEQFTPGPSNSLLSVFHDGNTYWVFTVPPGSVVERFNADVGTIGK